MKILAVILIILSLIQLFSPRNISKDEIKNMLLIPEVDKVLTILGYVVITYYLLGIFCGAYILFYL